MVDALRAGQRTGAVAKEFRPELILMLMLGAGSHPFDVTALVRESLGVDATSATIRDEVAALLRAMLSRGLFRDPGGR